ncbi:hypothetical protein PILCRDRAFT_93082 [Piloderma croceum F 1598]|uniref:Uncharacterized protein n=1 Tax=Piloderma croceum (strain F 1598) TaxID=765440 RepID=A0A0C3B7Y2_PILCF|nr:hypothetical protein PILCRDRAFT_93082 [Piloderma croceum F 1598]
MSSDQQKMYDHASNVVRLLSSDLPKEDVIKQIGDIVREAVEIAREATINSVLILHQRNSITPIVPKARPDSPKFLKIISELKLVIGTNHWFTAGAITVDRFFLLSRHWIIPHSLATNAEICEPPGNLRLCPAMFNL